jgi:hypothetical protein
LRIGDDFDSPDGRREGGIRYKGRSLLAVAAVLGRRRNVQAEITVKLHGGGGEAWKRGSDSSRYWSSAARTEGYECQSLVGGGRCAQGECETRKNFVQLRWDDLDVRNNMVALGVGGSRSTWSRGLWRGRMVPHNRITV